MSKRAFAEVDADYLHPTEPSSSLPPSYPSSKRQAKHSDLTFRPAHHAPSQLHSPHSHHHHNHHHQQHQPQQQHHNQQSTHAYPTGISWEQMVASLDEEIVRHILSVAAATSNYAQTLIYRHWTERMRGGWRSRKMFDALDTPTTTTTTAPTTMSTEMVVC